MLRGPKIAGATLLEVVVAMAMLGGLLSIGMALSTQVFQGIQKNRRLSALEREHAAARNMVFGLRARETSRTACQPHPFERPLPSGGCAPDLMPAPPTPAQTAAITDLRNKFFRWPEAALLNLGQVNPRLDLTYFQTTVAPAMSAAGCTGCHNGTPNAAMAPDISGKNFANYNDLLQLNGVTTNTTPVVSRALVNSKLGKRLLATTFSTSGLLAGSQGITHWINFIPINLTIKEQRRRGPLFQEDTNPSTAICPGPCLPGEVSEPTTCVPGFRLDCSPCPKGKKCPACIVYYNRTWSCIQHIDFSRFEVNVKVSSIQVEPTTGQSRFLSTEGTLQ